MIRAPWSAAAAGLFVLAGAASSLGATVRVAGDGHARIPFDARGGHLWVRGLVNSSDSLWIVVDTGAASSAMDAALASSLGLAPHGHNESLGAGGTQSGASVSDVTIAMGGVSIHRDELDVIELGPIGAQSGRAMHIIVGAELFESCVVRLDYPGGAMEVWDAEHAPGRLPGVVVPMTIEENHPYVEGVLTVPGRPPLAGRFVVDTGSNAGLIVSPDAARQAGLPQAFRHTLEAVGRGVGGEAHNRVGRATSFALGDLRFDAPLVVVPDSMGGRVSAPGTVGNIGGQLLGRCAVTFDYRRRSVGFERGAGFARAFEADMLGISTSRDTTGLVVRFVNPDTPAAEAGLRIGDVVTAVDGEPSVGIDPAALHERLQRPGRSVRLDIRRGVAKSTLVVKLRRLI